MDDAVHDFIRKAMAQGQSYSEIRAELLSVGWDPELVESSLRDIAMSIHPLPNASFAQPLPQKKATPARYVRSRYGLMLSALSLVLIGSGVIGGTFYYFRDRSTQQVAENPVAIVQDKSPVQASDSAYLTYTNGEYAFSFNIPKTWSVKEYSPESFGGEKRFAFGPVASLPQGFFSSGNYVWMKIYTVENVESYGNFANLKTLIGTDDTVLPTTLSEQLALRHNEYVISEYNERVYEIHLEQVGGSESSPIFSDASLEIMRSFKFI